MPRPATPCTFQHHAIDVCQVKGCYQKVTLYQGSTLTSGYLSWFSKHSVFLSRNLYPSEYIISITFLSAQTCGSEQWGKCTFNPSWASGIQWHRAWGDAQHCTMHINGIECTGELHSMSIMLELKIFTQVFLISPFSQKSRFINQYQSLHNVFPNQMACKTCSRWHCPSGLKCQLAGQWRSRGFQTTEVTKYMKGKCSETPWLSMTI